MLLRYNFNNIDPNLENSIGDTADSPHEIPSRNEALENMALIVEAIIRLHENNNFNANDIQVLNVTPGESPSDYTRETKRCLRNLMLWLHPDKKNWENDPFNQSTRLNEEKNLVRIFLLINSVSTGSFADSLSYGDSRKITILKRIIRTIIANGEQPYLKPLEVPIAPQANPAGAAPQPKPAAAPQPKPAAAPQAKPAGAAHQPKPAAAPQAKPAGTAPQAKPAAPAPISQAERDQAFTSYYWPQHTHQYRTWRPGQPAPANWQMPADIEAEVIRRRNPGNP